MDSFGVSMVGDGFTMETMEAMETNQQLIQERLVDAVTYNTVA